MENEICFCLDTAVSFYQSTNPKDPNGDIGSQSNRVGDKKIFQVATRTNKENIELAIENIKKSLIREFDDSAKLFIETCKSAQG